jgi:hypothetical protein
VAVVVRVYVVVVWGQPLNSNPESVREDMHLKKGVGIVSCNLTFVAHVAFDLDWIACPPC